MTLLVLRDAIVRMRIASFFILLFSVLVSAPSDAAIKIIGVAGASGYTINSATSTTATVYGGTGGASSIGADCATGDSPTDCCAGATGLGVCNRRRIGDSTDLTITFQSTDKDGVPRLIMGTTELISGTTVTKGNNTQLKVDWGQVCALLSNEAGSCDLAGAGLEAIRTGSFTVGIDVNNDGLLNTSDDVATINVSVLNPDPTDSGDADVINDCDNDNDEAAVCEWQVYPGDKKVFLESLTTDNSSFNQSLTGEVVKFRMYYSTDSGTGAPTQIGGTSYKDVELRKTTSGWEVVDNVITGFENLVPLYFRMAMVDRAGNEFYFTSDTAYNNLCTSTNPSPPGNGDCPFTAVPDRVLGLLSDDLNCFIATAAFGSLFHPIVTDLRYFRDRFLRPYQAGRKFINWYYSWSPAVAQWLVKHPGAKPVVRTLLLPLWGTAQLLKWWPATLTLLFLFAWIFLRVLPRTRKPHA